MSGLPAHASGISIAITCGSERPDWYRNSTALSSEAESLPPGHDHRKELRRSCRRYSGLSNIDWRACIQLTLPRTVLISPLCADVAVRVRQLPARKGIRREALVHQAQRARHQRIGQLEVELLDLRRQHQALVDDRAAGQRRNVESLLVLDLRLPRSRFPHAGGPRRAAARSRPRPCPCRLAQEELLDVRLRRARLAARSRRR